MVENVTNKVLGWGDQSQRRRTPDHDACGAGTILLDWLREIVVAAFLALSAILLPPLWQTLAAVYEVPLWLCILVWIPMIAWIVFLIRRYRTPAFERKFTELDIDGLIWKCGNTKTIGQRSRSHIVREDQKERRRFAPGI